MLFNVLMLGSSLLASADRLVVQADGRDRASLDAPVSLTVLEGDTGTFLSPRAPAEQLNRAAGVLVQAGSGREHLTSIRSPVLTGGAGSGSFLYLQDGIPLRAPGFANVNGLFHAGFPFASEVRVLRGPGDVGYGSGALHGAVDVRTPAPGDGVSMMTVSAGSFDRYRAAIAIDGEGAAFGISYLDDGGYRAQSGAKEAKARAAVRLGHGLLRLSVHHLEQETAGFVIGDDAYRDDALRRSNPDPEAFRNVRHGLLSFEQPFGAGGWQGSVTPFFRWTDMEFLQHFLPGDALEQNEHTSFGVQSAAYRALGRRGEVALGLDADLTAGTLREFQAAPTQFSFVQGLHYDYEVEAAEWAPFAKLSWQWTSQLSTEAGLRLTRTFYSYDNETIAGTIGRFLRPPDREDDFTALTGKLAAIFRLAPRHGIYASLARGARPPQTGELYRLQQNQQVADIEPETLDSLEIGWRWQARRAEIGVTAFAMDKRNVFFRDADGFNVTDGRTTHYGIEAEGTLQLGPDLTLRASGIYAEHRYGFDRAVGNASEVIADGDTVDTAPPTLASAQLLWTPAGPWRVEAATTHVGRYPMNASNTATYEGHDLIDLRVGRDLGDTLRATVIVRNLFDQRHARRADFAFGQERFFPGEERAAEFVLSAKF